MQDEEEEADDLGIYGDFFDNPTPKIRKNPTRQFKSDVVVNKVVKQEKINVDDKKIKEVEKPAQKESVILNNLATKDDTKEFESKQSQESEDVILKKKSNLKVKVETQTSISTHSDKNFIDDRCI